MSLYTDPEQYHIIAYMATAYTRFGEGCGYLTQNLPRNVCKPWPYKSI